MLAATSMKHCVKNGYLRWTSKYKNASNTERRRKHGVDVKREDARMHGYLDARSRHSKDSLDKAINDMIKLVVPVPFL